MSTLLYAQMTDQAKTQRQYQLEDGAPETPNQKLSKITQAVTALVPGEVLAIHAAILAYATVLGDDGDTMVAKPEVLKWSLPVLVATAAILFAIGHRGKWSFADGGRLLVPPVAFLTWTLLTGTSAATPWLADYDRGWILLAGGVLGAVVVAASLRLAPRTST